MVITIHVLPTEINKVNDKINHIHGWEFVLLQYNRVYSLFTTNRPGDRDGKSSECLLTRLTGPVKAWGREFQITAKGCYLNLTSDQLMCWPMTAPKLHCAPSRGWHALPCHFNPGQARFTPPDVTHSTKVIGRGAKGGKYLVKEVLWTFLKYRRVYSRCETPMPPDAIFLSKTV